MQSEPFADLPAPSDTPPTVYATVSPNAICQPMMMVELASDGSVLTANDTFTDRMGFAVAALRGMNYASLCGTEECALAPFGAVREQVAGGRSYSAIARCAGRSGETIWLNTTFSPILDDAGQLVRIIVVATDITVETRQREELRVLLMGVNAIGNAILVSGADNRIIHVNDGYKRMFGATDEGVIGKTLSYLMTSARSDRALTRYLDQRTAHRDGYQDELQVFDGSGKPLWVAAVANPVFGADGSLTHVVDVLTDITQTKIYEVLQRKVLHALMAEAPVKEVMEIVCREVESLAPEVTAAVLAVDAQGLLHPLAAPSMSDEFIVLMDGLQADPDVCASGMAAYLGEPVVVADIEHSPLWANWRDVLVPLGLKACWSSPINANDGRVIGTLVFYFREPREPDSAHRRLVDVCVHLCSLALDRDQTRARIRQLAFYDELTGLPNRSFLKVKTEQAIGEMALCKASLAVLFLNIDRVKQVNDTLGHSTGDALLREIATRLRRVVRGGDLVGRLSSDEFAIVLPQSDANCALTVSENLLAELTRPFDTGGTTLQPSVSVGVSIYPDNGEDVDALLRHADMAMDRAKSEGSPRARFFSAEMNTLAQEKHALEAAFRLALEDRRLRLHYQPQFHLTSGALYGVEALARWNHPDLGQISPSRFVPLAEESGLIGLLGSWAVGEACRQLAEWRRRGFNVPRISVNLSPTNFHHVFLCEEISDSLIRHGLAASELTLEMTESVLMDTNPGTLRTIDALHELGVHLSLDDFGTGYSSLGHLRWLPANELKLDRSFVQGLESDRAARALSSAIIRIGESLNLSVVAEGIENEAQRSFLAEQGCGAGQGFFYTEALQAPDFERWCKDYCPNPASGG